jgi:taurine dehydrogenase large subunit
VDVAIIGAGYTGLSCAWHLAREHGIRAVVLEANRPGWGASGRNGSFVRGAVGRLSFPQIVEKWGVEAGRSAFAEAHAALATTRALIQAGPIDCDVQPDGRLKIAHRLSRLRYLEEEARVLREVMGYPAELIDTATLRRDYVGEAEAHGALRTLDSFGVHPLKLAFGVLRLCREAGAVVHPATPVTAWRKEGQQHVLTTPGGEVRAATVVVATNGYTPDRLHPALQGRLLPVLSHIIVTRPLSAEEQAACNFVTTDILSDTRSLLHYYRRLPDGRLLFGGRGEVHPGPKGRARVTARLLTTLKVKFPPLAGVTVEYSWDGWVCLSWDYVPHIYHAEGDPTLLYGLAYSGNGVATGLYAGRLLAARAAGKAPERSDLPLATPLPRFPFASLRRQGQSALYAWYRFKDQRD